MVRILISVLAGLALIGQTPADLYTYEEYRAWVAQQPAAVQQSADILDLYKAHLMEKGEDGADADSKVRAIRQQEGAAGTPFLMEMLTGRKPGTVLVVGGGPNAQWLAGRGWQVTERAAGVDARWDVIVMTGEHPRAEALVRWLKPGGLLVMERMGRATPPAGLRTIRRAEKDGAYCGEKPR